MRFALVWLVTVLPPSELLASEQARTEDAATPTLPARPLTLAELVDFALRTSPATRASWHAARAAAAEVGSRRAAYLPSVDATGTLTRAHSPALGGRYVIEQTTYGPALTASWLLLDFGARSAAIDEARAALVAADWGHNAAVQQVILGVQQSYYGYVDARARLIAAESSVHEAETSLRAAEERLAAGVAAQLEVLQARTALSQARLLAQQLAGRIESLRGALAVSCGLPPNTAVEVESPPEHVPTEVLSRDVGELIAEAARQRPELAAARAQALAAATEVRRARAGALPSLSAVGHAGRTYYEPHPYARYGDNWSGGLVLRWPLFSGLSTPYDTAKAQSDAAAAEARVDTVAQQVALEVWQSYYDLKTADRAIESARDLVESAAQAERVAAGRYEQGVGDLLDVLTAQATLASARAQQIGTRSDWYVAVARLAHSIGALESTPPGSAIHDSP